MLVIMNRVIATTGGAHFAIINTAQSARKSSRFCPGRSKLLQRGITLSSAYLREFHNP